MGRIKGKQNYRLMSNDFPLIRVAAYVLTYPFCVVFPRGDDSRYENIRISTQRNATKVLLPTK